MSSTERKNRAGAALAAAALALLLLPCRGQENPRIRKLWFYLSMNFLVKEKLEASLALLERAEKAGYTGVVVADSKFARWDVLPPRYAAGVARFRRRCRELGLECVASLFPMGYAGSLLSRKPELAAGLPVKDAPFRVKGARLVPADDSLRLENGGFEEYRGDRPKGWRFVDKPGRITFVDHRVRHGGKVSLRMENIGKWDPAHGHGRACQTLEVKPFRYYHLSAWVRTEGFEAADRVRVLVLGKDGASLCFLQPRILARQPWRKIHVTFNTLDHRKVNVYLGVWGGKAGKIWWDDVKIEPAGLVNLVRRKGTPFRVVSRDGKVVYREGRDFTGAADPFLFHTPRKAGTWVWHTPPFPLVPKGSRMAEGEAVLVSYYHTAFIRRSQAMVCMSVPALYDFLAWQAKEVKRHVRPDGYFMQHDEIRIQGWDRSCLDRKMTPGEILADNVKRCAAILKKTDPGKPVYVWSDMFDPFHNAKKKGRYYLVRGDGPWWGSWKGLPESVIVVNWHRHQPGRLESLKFFAGRGHRQVLAGYYDGDPARIVEWLRDAAKVQGVIGVMYTTWMHDYRDLERFARILRPWRER